MAEIIENTEVAPDVFRMRVEAPKIARKRKAGQFVIVRAGEESERIPLTIADASPDEGTITLYVQRTGASTTEIVSRGAGGELADVVGPLGRPTELIESGVAACVGGGIGVAPILPIAAALKERGVEVVAILGARTSELMILKDEMAAIADELILTTDDGSAGRKGFVTDALKALLGERRLDVVYAIGPVVMMKAVCRVTRPAGVKTIVSLNPIMVDGTGMCGGCRVTVGGRSRFVCVDGPEFDGHQVDFDELTKRLNTYRHNEAVGREHLESAHPECRINRGGTNHG